MSLPSGYTRLEYIQSSGTQHIDTDFKPNQNTTIAAEFVVLDASNDGAYLYGGGTGTARLEAYPWDGKLEFNYGSAHPFVGTVYANKRFYISQDKTKYTLSYFDGSGEWTGNHAEQSFSSAYTLAIFALNRGTVAYPTAGMQLYSCQIYDNGTLVRDFIPCQKPDSAIGLWDDVNSVFYGNSGTGTFTAGPVIQPPGTPSGLSHALSVRLVWSTVSGAASYNIYRDGAFVGSSNTPTFVDVSAAENQTYVYAVSAVGQGGEGEPATLTVYTKAGYFEYKPLIESANFQ